MDVQKKHYTTSQAARLLSVSADTVLKWVKAGKLDSYRTPGGHHRIPAEALGGLLPDGSAGALPSETDKGFDYCWNFYADNEGVRDECRDCVAFKSKARRCYEMRDIPEEFGHLKLFCQTSCEECDFYQLTHLQRRSVLVVSRNTGWLSDPDAWNTGTGLLLEFATSEYECSAVIEKFRPDFIVLDCSFGVKRTRDICQHLNRDERIPFTRIILTSHRTNWTEECEQEVCGWIEKPFTMAQLGEFIEGTSRLEAANGTVA